MQAFPSVQLVPPGASGFEQIPVPGLHVPATWHGSLALQTVAVPGVQTPVWHVSPVVHASPSLHVIPSGAATFTQAPVAGSQAETWHASLGVQVTGFDPTQEPAWQVSVCVQALPSPHALPFGFSGFEQIPVAGAQVPAVWH